VAVRWLVILLLGVAVANADEMPRACAPAETPEICGLKIQRNNALDELAIAYGESRRAAEAEKVKDEYWQKWVEGDLAKALWWDRYRGIRKP
jgi:hypothetical protein